MDFPTLSLGIDQMAIEYSRPERHLKTCCSNIVTCGTDSVTQEVIPERLIRQKWHQTSRNLKCGDVMLLHDKSPIKGSYILGIVESVKLGNDGLVRSCTIGYTVASKKDSVDKYSGGKRISVTRSIQRLSLILPVEEQESPLQVVNNDVVMVSKS